MKKTILLTFSLIFMACTAAFMLRAATAADDNGEARAKKERETMVNDPTYVKKDGEAIIYLAGGCFWGMEKYMEGIPGVLDAVSGYANGRTKERVSYEQLCAGGTGYKETVRVVYDPSKVSLETLLFAFFKVVDPSVRDRQGNDVGAQYQTGVFYTDAAAEAVVRRVAEIERRRAAGGFYVLVEPLRIFHEAEEYHQNYLTKHPNGYCHISREEMEEARGIKIDAAPYRKPADDELKKRLTERQYAVTQKNGTEPPFDNEYYDNQERGIYVDVVTGEPLFSSKDKYDSSCGWPAFTKGLDDGALVYKEDASYGMRRTEVRSRAGDSHLGHVFTGDRESPNGVRYCINSAALRFIPYEEMDKEGYGEFKKYVE